MTLVRQLPYIYGQFSHKINHNQVNQFALEFRSENVLSFVFCSFPFKHNTKSKDSKAVIVFNKTSFRIFDSFKLVLKLEVLFISFFIDFSNERFYKQI